MARVLSHHSKLGTTVTALKKGADNVTCTLKDKAGNVAASSASALRSD